MDTATVRGISLFANLTEEELKLILQLAHDIPFDNGKEIIRQGQSHSSLYVVADGVLHVSRKTDQRNVLLGRLEKGSFFGEIGLFDPGPASATVRAMSKGNVLEIRRDDFDRFLETKPSVACKILKAMMQEMSKRLRGVDQRLVTSVFWGEGLAK